MIGKCTFRCKEAFSHVFFHPALFQVRAGNSQTLPSHLDPQTDSRSEFFYIVYGKPAYGSGKLRDAGVACGCHFDERGCG